MHQEYMVCIGVCGLNCNLCDDKKNGECHGCHCNADDCAASWHQTHCRIHRCANQKGYVTCTDCDDMPCSMLSAFCFDPKWPSHLPCLENLRRIKRIGLEEWAAEQKAFWDDPHIHE